MFNKKIATFALGISALLILFIFLTLVVSGCDKKENAQKAEKSPVAQEEKINFLLDEFKEFPDDKNTQEKLVKIGKPVISHLRLFLADKENYKITRKGRLYKKDPYVNSARFATGWEMTPGYMCEVRLGTVRVLDRIGGEEAIDLLIYAINDPDGLVAEAATEALAERKEKRAVDPLIKAMKNHLFPSAVEALGKIGDERAINPLLVELKNKERIERYDLYKYHINEALANIKAVSSK